MFNCRLTSTKLLNIAAASSVAIFFLLDRLLKPVALSLPDGKTMPIIKNLFSFGFTANHRIALSLPLEGAWLNYFIALILVFIIFKFVKTIKEKNRIDEVIAWGAIMLGAFSNLNDRLSYGYVVDYLEISYLTALNIADILISAGAFYIIVKGLRKK